MLSQPIQETIYRMRVNDGRNGPLIEALLRLHGGLFEEPALIDENRIARLMDWHTDTVRTRLIRVRQAQGPLLPATQRCPFHYTAASP